MYIACQRACKLEKALCTSDERHAADISQYYCVPVLGKCLVLSLLGMFFVAFIPRCPPSLRQHATYSRDLSFVSYVFCEGQPTQAIVFLTRWCLYNWHFLAAIDGYSRYSKVVKLNGDSFRLRRSRMSEAAFLDRLCTHVGCREFWLCYPRSQDHVLEDPWKSHPASANIPHTLGTESELSTTALHIALKTPWRNVGALVYLNFSNYSLALSHIQIHFI
jgi:hypothetical protein